jgi:type II secretory pathway pseudopilin PulG
MHILAKKPRSTASAGFTIIETLIVLIIAGLFLLIVFEALPALGRSSRNNQRKQDVQAVLEAISDYELNNSGDAPACGYAGYASCYGTNNLLQYAKLTYYTSTTQVTNTNGVTVTGQVAVFVQQNTHPASPFYAANLSPLPPVVASLEQIYVYNYAKCDANNDGGATIAGAGYSDIVALYAIETGSTSVAGECQQL